MKKTLFVLALAALAGCTGTSDNAGKQPAKSAETNTASEAGAASGMAAMEGDHQVVHVTVTPHGYEPSTLQLKAGVPTRIVFKQTSDSECLSHVKIPDFGVEATDLPLNQETSIDFTPNQSGSYTFTCGMEMVKGTIVVAS